MEEWDKCCVYLSMYAKGCVWNTEQRDPNLVYRFTPHHEGFHITNEGCVRYSIETKHLRQKKKKDDDQLKLLTFTLLKWFVFYPTDLFNLKKSFG